MNGLSCGDPQNIFSEHARTAVRRIDVSSESKNRTDILRGVMSGIFVRLDANVNDM